MPVEAASSMPTKVTDSPSPPRTRAEQPPHGLQQFAGDARALQHHAHEDEQRHRDQHLVGLVHQAEDAVVEGLQEAQRAHHAVADEEALLEIRADEGEEQPDAGQRERHRIAAQQQRDGGGEHDQVEMVDEEIHGSASVQRFFVAIGVVDLVAEQAQAALIAVEIA
jgi:hypothetical protein